MSNSYCNAGRRFGNWFLSGKVTKGRDANFTLSSLHENNIDVPHKTNTNNNSIKRNNTGTNKYIDNLRLIIINNQNVIRKNLTDNYKKLKLSNYTKKKCLKVLR